MANTAVKVRPEVNSRGIVLNPVATPNEDRGHAFRSAVRDKVVGLATKALFAGTLTFAIGAAGGGIASAATTSTLPSIPSTSPYVPAPAAAQAAEQKINSSIIAAQDISMQHHQRTAESGNVQVAINDLASNPQASALIFYQAYLFSQTNNPGASSPLAGAYVKAANISLGLLWPQSLQLQTSQEMNAMQAQHEQIAIQYNQHRQEIKTLKHPKAQDRSLGHEISHTIDSSVDLMKRAIHDLLSNRTSAVITTGTVLALLVMGGIRLAKKGIPGPITTTPSASELEEEKIENEPTGGGLAGPGNF